jgi:hypothetical protein
MATTATSTVSICVAPTVDGLRELIVPVLERELAELAADPLIAAQSLKPGDLTATVARWIERVASRAGYLTETIDPTSRVVLECGHPAPKFGVTELDLAPDPSLTDQLYAIGIWSRFISRRRKWRMTISPTLMSDIVANAACAHPVLTVQVARWRTVRFFVVARDITAAEVTGRAIRSVLQPAGDIGQTPWQAEIVQAVGERGLGIRSGAGMALTPQWAGPEGHPDWQALRSRLVRVAHLIDCQLIEPAPSRPAT